MKRQRIKILQGWLFLAWIVPIIQAVSNDDGILALSQLPSEDQTSRKRLRQLRGTHDRRSYRLRSMGIRPRKRQKRDSGVENDEDANENARSNNDVDETDSPSYETRKRKRNANSSKISNRVQSKHRPYGSKGKGKRVYYKRRKRRKKRSRKKARAEGYLGKGGRRKDDICKQYDFGTRTLANGDRKFRNIFDRTRPANGKGGFSYQNNRFDHVSGGIFGKGNIRNIFDRDLFFRHREWYLEDRQDRKTNEGAYCDQNVLELAGKAPELSAFVRLVEQAGLEDIFDCPGPFTFLAPTNEAFRSIDTNFWGMVLGQNNKKALEDIVLYHVLPGSFYTDTFQAGIQKTLQGESVEISLDPLTFNDSRKLEGEASSCNGIIHIIVGDILIPPSFDDGSSEPEVPEVCLMLDFRFLSERHLQLQGEVCAPNVLQVAQDDPAMSIFVSLIERSGLEEIFLCAGPFTTLVPTNDAFAALDPTVIAFFLRPENADLLRDFLLYHIIGGLELTTEIAEGQLVTLQGQAVEAKRDPVTFNGATVLEADIPACNGVIDKIGDVLLFPEFPAAPPATPSAVTTLAPVLPTFTPQPTEAQRPLTSAPTTDVSAATPTAAPASPTFAPTSEVTPGTATAAPTFSDSGMITIAPTSDGSAFVRVKLTDYYIALVVPALEEEPSQEVVESLFNVTTQFWIDSFETYYADSDIQFRGLDNTIVEFLYDADLPEPGFNMYFEWNTVVLYELESPVPPRPAETFGIMANADLVSYILDYVRTIPELVTTNEVDFKALERLQNTPENDLANSTYMKNISLPSRDEAAAVSIDTEDDSLLLNLNGTSKKLQAFGDETIISSNFSNSINTEDVDLSSPFKSKQKSSIDRSQLSDPQSRLLAHSDKPSNNVTHIDEEISHAQSSRNEIAGNGGEIHKNIYCLECIESLGEGSRVRVVEADERVRVPQKGSRVIVLS